MEAKTRGLIFDPFSGISGDMILGALIDLGLTEEWLRDLVSSLPVAVELDIGRVTRGSLSAASVSVNPTGAEPERHLADVLEIIDRANLDGRVTELASEAFNKLAEVEGAIHGMPPDRIHFHEVGAADAIVDIVGAAAGITQLSIDACFTRPVAVGHGWITSAHGRLPVPAPATLRLLEGLPIFETELDFELTTPTGAVLLATLTGGERAPASYTPVRSGFGAGNRDPETHPNCLRVVLAELEASRHMWVLQADVDDMSPEYLPPLIEELQAAGAIDVWTHPVQMKKGRLGTRIEALVQDSAREAVSHALLEGSSTLGLRFWPVERQTLPRSLNRIKWRGHPIRLKTAITPGGHVRCKPEYDDIVDAARALNVPAWKARQDIEHLLRTDPEC
jgi:uncharacterized protein (TIGR00299 family) protein